jgi:hypothetical protein
LPNGNGSTYCYALPNGNSQERSWCGMDNGCFCYWRPRHMTR